MLVVHTSLSPRVVVQVLPSQVTPFSWTQSAVAEQKSPGTPSPTKVFGVGGNVSGFAITPQVAVAGAVDGSNHIGSSVTQSGAVSSQFWILKVVSTSSLTLTQVFGPSSVCVMLPHE